MTDIRYDQFNDNDFQPGSNLYVCSSSTEVFPVDSSTRVLQLTPTVFFR